MPKTLPKKSTLSPLKQAFLALEEMQAKLDAMERVPGRAYRYHWDGVSITWRDQ